MATSVVSGASFATHAVRAYGRSAAQRSSAAAPRALPRAGKPAGFARKVACKAKDDALVAGTVFEPFSEVQGELATVSSSSDDVSFARMNYADTCEAAINEQINVEYNVSYIYHALFAYFDRDNVGLEGLAAYFKAGSVEEREHAEKLMEYQNIRGGRVKLQSIVMPEMEFDNSEKGDALNAMELALAMEKLNFEKLTQLHRVAEAAGDAQMCDFVEGYLGEQVEAVKEVAEYVSQLRRIGKGHGVWDWDQALKEAQA